MTEKKDLLGPFSPTGYRQLHRGSGPQSPNLLLSKRQSYCLGVLSGVSLVLLISLANSLNQSNGGSSNSGFAFLIRSPKMLITDGDYTEADLKSGAVAGTNEGYSDVQGSSEESSHGEIAEKGVGDEPNEADRCGGIGPHAGDCFARCHRRTESGHCVKELFRFYDEAYRPLWPARVDLLIRSYVSDKFFLLELLFDSIEQMWPRGIGDVILVLDEGEHLVEDIVPTWVKVYYEKNYLNLPGKIVQQWSYLWADNYTTAPYIAIIDDDVIFNLKVTPGLLFNLTDGKPYVIGSRQKQMNHWVPSTRYFVGKETYFANFMVQLPFTFPSAVLPKFRSHVAKLHNKPFDAAFKRFAVYGPKVERTQIAHTTLGNYMWSFTKDEVHWALEWTRHPPIPRVGVHVPYSTPFRTATKNNDNAPRVIQTYISLAGYFSKEAVCHAFPKGQLDRCANITRFEQRQIWQYVMDWYDWPAIRRKERNATFVYDHYRAELWCMYDKVAKAETQQWTDNFGLKRQELIAGMRSFCITSHSNNL